MYWRVAHTAASYTGSVRSMTQDEKSLLKHGLFWALVFAVFWLLVSAVKSTVVAIIAQGIWMAFLWWIFYRKAQKKKSE